MLLQLMIDVFRRFASAYATYAFRYLFATPAHIDYAADVTLYVVYVATDADMALRAVMRRYVTAVR